MNSTDLFTQYLTQLSNRTAAQLNLSNVATNAKRLKLALQNGYVSGSRHAAFFVVTFEVLGSHSQLTSMKKKERLQYSLAIAEVYRDHLHGRTTNVETSLKTAFHRRNIFPSSITPTVLQCGTSLIKAGVK